MHIEPREPVLHCKPRLLEPSLSSASIFSYPVGSSPTASLLMKTRSQQWSGDDITESHVSLLFFCAFWCVWSMLVYPLPYLLHCLWSRGKVSRFYLQRVDSFSGRNKLCLQKWPRFLEDVFIRFSNSRGSWRFHGVRVNRCTIPVSMSALMWGLMQILSVYFFVWSVCHTRCCCCLYGDPRCERLRSISFSSEETCYSCSSPSRCIWLKAFPSHGI